MASRGKKSCQTNGQMADTVSKQPGPSKQMSRPQNSATDNLDSQYAPSKQKSLPENNANDPPELSDSDADTNPSSPSASESSEAGETHDTDDDSNEEDISVRGQAKMGFDWGTEKILMLELDDNNEVIGENAKKLSSQLGIIAKDGNKLPLTYTDSRAVPVTNKDNIWNDIKENTNLTDTYKDKCLKKVGKLWRDWKTRLKSKYFYDNRNDKSYLLSHCPHRVEEEQWPILVDYWSSKKVKKASKTNRKSRKKLKLPPRMGRIDIPNLRENFRQEKGRLPSKLELFMYSRERKDGQPLDDFTSQKIGTLKKLKEQLPDEVQNDIAANDKIYDDTIVNEAPGCLRSCQSTCRNNEVRASQQKFDRTVEEKIADIQKDLEIKMKAEIHEKVSKLKEEWMSQLEQICHEIPNFQTSNRPVLESSDSHLTPSLQNDESPNGLLHPSGSGHANESSEMSKDINNMNEDNAIIGSESFSPKGL